VQVAYSRMHEEFINNGVHVDVGSLFHQQLSNSSVPHPGYSSLSGGLFNAFDPLAKRRNAKLSSLPRFWVGDYSTNINSIMDSTFPIPFESFHRS